MGDRGLGSDYWGCKGKVKWTNRGEFFQGLEAFFLGGRRLLKGLVLLDERDDLFQVPLTNVTFMSRSSATRPGKGAPRILC